ncbi:MAG: hypothetical protein KDB69_04850, partial [Acidimicrobiia bacterium]|nr:hypothetical protein [Acidimicrobiia bacterium]
DELASYLGWKGSEVVIRAQLRAPAMRARRVVEPEIVPVTVVGDPDTIAWLDLPLTPDVTTVARYAVDAGCHVGVLPVDDAMDEVRTARLPAPTVVIMAAVPLHDIGGGSRGAQLAFELVRRSYSVVYVHRFPTAESTDLGLRYLHPRLMQVSYDRFDAASLALRSTPGLVVVEAPIRDFVAPLELLVREGWSSVYDIIDDWTDRSLGGDWYDAEVERSIAGLVTAVTASAPDLVSHATRLGRNAVLVPNGVNEVVFATALDHRRPPDLPPGRVIGYHGSLYGEWFDWDALAHVADAFPGHAIAVIGDDGGVRRSLPTNIHFLGLKPQGDLPAYLGHLEVGVVPFVVNDVTHAVSPLKVFEFLAAGVPVAAPPLRALDGVSGVTTDVDLAVAVEGAIRGPRPDPVRALAEHGWGGRLRILFDAVGWDLSDVDGSTVRVVTRKPVHHRREDRLVH